MRFFLANKNAVTASAEARRRACLVIMMALVPIACSHPRDTALRQLTKVEGELAAAELDAVEFARDERAEVLQRVDGLRAAFERKDYESIASSADEVLIEVRNLRVIAVTRKRSILQAQRREMNGPLRSVPSAAGL